MKPWDASRATSRRVGTCWAEVGSKVGSGAPTPDGPEGRRRQYARQQAEAQKARLGQDLKVFVVGEINDDLVLGPK